MGFLAFGLFLLLLGFALALSGLEILRYATWLCIAIGAIFVVVHVAVGPRRRPAGRRNT